MLTYNHEKYIKTAIESVLSQQCDFSFEIVIGDDHSSDSTMTILQAYKKKFPSLIKLVIQKKNKGIQQNLLDTYKVCSGEYIAYLEGDDYWISSHKLQQQVDFLDRHPDYIGCTHQCQLVDKNGIVTEKVAPYYCKTRNYTVKQLEHFELPGQSSTLVLRSLPKREVEELTKKAKQVCIPADRLLTLVMITKGKIYCMQDILGSYRYIREKGASNWSSKFARHNFVIMLYNYYIMYVLKKIAVSYHIHLTFTSVKVQLYVQKCNDLKKSYCIKRVLSTSLLFLLLPAKAKKHYRSEFYTIVTRKIIRKV